MAEMFLSLHDVGEELGVSVQTVRRWVKAGELAAYKPGKEYRIKSSDLEEFLKTREVDPKAAAPPFDSDEQRRREKYLPWLEFALRYEDRWLKKAKRGDLDESAIREWKATLQDLGKTVLRLREEEERGWSQEKILELEDELIMRKVGASLMGPLISILDAHQALLDEDELARFRRERQTVERDLDLAING